jgi:hypothetical protein
MAHLRGNIDDRAGQLGFDETARDRLRHEKRGAHIEREDRVEILDLDVGEVSRSVHAGIIDQNLKRLAVGDGLLRSLDVGDIEHQRFGLLPAVADRGGGGFNLGFGARRKRDMRAGRSQRRRRRKPNAAPAAGDQRALAVETEGGSFGEAD